MSRRSWRQPKSCQKIGIGNRCIAGADVGEHRSRWKLQNRGDANVDHIDPVAIDQPVGSLRDHDSRAASGRQCQGIGAACGVVHEPHFARRLQRENACPRQRSRQFQDSVRVLRQRERLRRARDGNRLCGRYRILNRNKIVVIVIAPIVIVQPIRHKKKLEKRG